MRIITGALAFFDSSAGIAIADGARNLAAEAAAGVLADEHDVVRLDADPAGDVRHRLRGALRGAVQVQLAVLPVGHRRARLERLVARWTASRSVSSRMRAASLKPASTSPNAHVSGALPIGSWPSVAAAKSAAVHFDVGDLQRAGRRRCRRCPAVRAFGAAGAQALERIDDEGQRLELDVDAVRSPRPPSSRRRRRRPESARPRRRGSSVSAASAAAAAAAAPVRRAASAAPAAPGRSSAVQDAPSRPASPAPRSCRCCATRACGIGLSSSLANSMPSARKSSAYFALPVTFATRSGVV